MSATKNKSGEPSVIGMLSYGMLTALLSALLGCLYMAAFPAPSFKDERALAKFQEDRQDTLSRPGDIYFMQGPSSRDQAWIAKRQAWVDGDTKNITFSHGELNAWLAAKFKVATAPSNEDGPKVFIIPGVPNIYVSAELITLSLQTEFIIFGNNYTRTAIITGAIDDSSGRAEFTIKSLSIDNAVVPFISVLGRRIVDTLLQAYSGSEEFTMIKEAWLKVESVNQSDGSLCFQIR
ncbi:MAG: hypothetical protein ABF323_00450 [Lentimonas sp.]